MSNSNAPVDVTALIDDFVAKLVEDSELDPAIAAMLQRLHSGGRLSTDAIVRELGDLRRQAEQEPVYAS